MENELNERLYIIEDLNDNRAIIYDNYTATLYVVPIGVCKVLKDYINYGVIDNKVQDYINNFNKQLNSKEKIKSYDLIKENELGTVKIIISNDCNLKCKYCYANGGNYSSSKSLMKEDVARFIAIRLGQQFRKIKDINFFGGEPLLNIKAIEVFCNEMEHQYNLGNIKEIPKYSLTTNGTIINNHIIEIIRKYNINILVSIDGPETINDKYRVYENNLGSYKFIEKNIKILKEKVGQPLCVECTYNAEHYNNNWSYSKYMKFIKEKFDIDYSFIVPVQLTENQKHELDMGLDIDALKDIKSKSFEDLFNIFLEEGLVEHEILGFLSKFRAKHYINHYCQAGVSQIAIDVNGDIYPCQLFLSNEELKEKYYMGNIIHDNFVENQYYTKINKELIELNKINNKCNNCSSKLFCSTCIAEVYVKNGTLNPKSEEYCIRIKEQKEDFLKHLSTIYLNKTNWLVFKSRVEEIKKKVNSKGISI